MTIEKYWVNQLHLSNKNYPSEFTRVQVVKLSDLAEAVKEFEVTKHYCGKEAWLRLIWSEDWQKFKKDIFGVSGGDKE